MARQPKMAKTALDGEIDALARRSDHRVLAVWAADCAARVLRHFEDAFPDDDRPRQALAALHRWIKTGEFRMAVIRKASLDAHAAPVDADAVLQERAWQLEHLRQLSVEPA